MTYKGNYKKRIGDYIFAEEIGKDEKITQYIVIDNKNGKLYMGKIIPLQFLDDEYDKNIIINSQREFNILEGLKNENIITYKTQKTTTNNIYTIKEYYNGGNLKDFQKYYINKNKTQFNEKFIQNVIRQITSGLEYLHNKNIIHRFLKLENIFININKYENKLINGTIPPKIHYSQMNIDEPITFKIGNFYHSKNLVKNTQISPDSHFYIEPNYMTPQMVENVKNNNPNQNIYDDKNFDIWSLGIITYELLTGEKPFDGKNKEDIYNNILTRKYDIPGNLKASKEIISFINGIFKYNPFKKYDLSQIQEHPFLKNNVENFNYDEKVNNSNYEEKRVNIDSGESPPSKVYILPNDDSMIKPKVESKAIESGESPPSKVYILPNDDSMIKPKVESEFNLQKIDNEITNLKENIKNLIKEKENIIQKFEKELSELK